MIDIRIALIPLKTLWYNIKRKFKQMTCEHTKATQIGRLGEAHLAHCQDCDKIVHFVRKEK